MEDEYFKKQITTEDETQDKKALSENKADDGMSLESP